MQTAPDWFVERLTADSGGRLRIRWSMKKGEWHIEQKVGREAVPPYRIDPYDDSLIRAKDGYWFVLAIRPGTRMPCPTCHSTITVPAMRFEETKCPYCKRNGKDGRTTAVYFPLSESLLEHLRKIDPNREGGKRLAAEADAANEAFLASEQRRRANEIEAISKEHFTNIFDIQSVGYTGKEKSWTQ